MYWSADHVVKHSGTIPDAAYASCAVQPNPNGGQFDFLRSSARTPHGAYV